MKITRLLPLLVLCATLAAQDQTGDPFADLSLGGMKIRELGPAMMSGRIADLAVHPEKPATWYIAVASGGVWKTHNAGTTWKPLFDDQPSYSIGAITICPHDPQTIWVGTGENNSQRSVGYGDGLYRSDDGGDTWRRVGLKHSEHIAKIVVHPDDRNTVYVAAQGPLWSAGGDRGLYKTEDGGETWQLILAIDGDTGVTDFVMDPRDPDIILAASYTRRRHVWTLVNGGPGSGVHLTEDGGRTWKKITRGLPSVELGRVGLARSPANPDVCYAIVEAQMGKGGFFRSDDGGRTWKKQSNKVSPSPQYYQELVCDPHDVNRVYSLETFLQRSDDGGKTWFQYPEDRKHVDNHALWIDPTDTDHLVAGCDGGVYESWDLGDTWHFKSSLPITQFYRVTPDDDLPFYNVYGGTQDNATQGGPSRTTSVRGIRNADWFLTVFGDGFKTAIEPGNPDIIYSQWQYGGLVRHDRRNGETVDIQPQVSPDEAPLRWNWDSALIISPHNAQRVYYAAQRLFRSDDRGNTWTPVSGDLSRDLDRNQLPVMGRVQSVDAVAKNNSTSFYGSIVSLDESPLVEGLIYVGTDDGLVQVTENGGETWRKIESFPGVPDMSYVVDVLASHHDSERVFVLLNDHKRGNFLPYVLVSDDRGRSFRAITANLPERGSTYTIIEDHVDPDLLFVGTEFGVFASLDRGGHWKQLKSGIPTVAVRDLEIQKRENDLVIGTFGRGIYILDDFAPLRAIEPKTLEAEATLFPVRRAWWYVERSDLDTRFQGDGHWTAKNPDFGATLSYYLPESLMTAEQVRRKAEKAAIKKGEDTPYPSWDALRAEDAERSPKVWLFIEDSAGRVVRRLSGPTGKGLHRLAWDLREPSTGPVSLTQAPRAPWSRGGGGPLVIPGTYTVRLHVEKDGVLGEALGRQSFEVVAITNATLPAKDRAAAHAFQKTVGEWHRKMTTAGRVRGNVAERLRYLRAALDRVPGAAASLAPGVAALEDRLRAVTTALNGDRTVSSRSEATHPGLASRVSRVLGSVLTSTADATGTHEQTIRMVAERAPAVLAELRAIAEEALPALEAAFEAAGAPYTPGRSLIKD